MMTMTLSDQISRGAKRLPQQLMLWCGLLFFAVTCSHLDAYLGEYDEGPTLQAAMLNRDGYKLYDEIVYNKPPLLVWWLNLGMHLGGISLQVGRLTIVWITFVGYFAFGALAAQWFGPWAGPLAMALLFGAPDLVARMLAATNELPAISMVSLSLLAHTRHRKSASPTYATVAGVAFGLALGLHPLVIYAAVPLGLLILIPVGQAPSFRHWRTDCLYPVLVFIISALSVSLLWLWIVFGDGFSKWVVAYNSAPLGPGLADSAANNLKALVSYYLEEKWYYSLAFVIACIAALTKPEHRTAMIVTTAWMAATVATLSMLRPMWEHYTVLGLFPLIIGISGGISVWLQSSNRQRFATTRSTAGKKVAVWIAAVGLASAAVALTLLLPNWPDWPESHIALREFISHEVAKDEFVVVDDPLVAFIAGRRVPPRLVDSSEKRVSTRYLRPPDIIAAMLESPARYLVFANGRFSSLYSLVSWAENEAELYADTADYRAFKFEPSLDIDVPLSAQLGDQIYLVGYTLDTESPLTITLFWEAVDLPSDNYHIFVHLTDGDGNLVAQADAAPMHGALPTTAWPLDTIIPHTVTVDDRLLPGTYTLSAGMYSYPDVVRLPVTSTDGASAVDDALILTTVKIQ